MTYTLKQHPASAVFPMIPAHEYQALVADIKANGQQVPILVEGAQVIDGWHRYRACMDIDVKTEASKEGEDNEKFLQRAVKEAGIQQAQTYNLMRLAGYHEKK